MQMLLFAAGIRKIHHNGFVMHSRQEFFDDVFRLHAQADSVHAGMASQKIALHNGLVDEQLHMVVLVVHQAHDGYRAGRDIEVFFHVCRICERQPRGADGA